MHHPPHDHVALIINAVATIMLGSFAILMALFPWEYGKMAGDFYAPAKAWTGWHRYLAGVAAMILLLLFTAGMLVLAFGPAVGLVFLSIRLTPHLPFVQNWASADQGMLRSAIAILCFAGWMGIFFLLLNRFTGDSKKAV